MGGCRFPRAVAETDALHRPCVGEHHAGRVENDPAGQQVACRVMSRGRSLHHVDGEFDPFVMCRLARPGGARQGDSGFGQIADEFARNFAEPRRMQRPVAVEAAVQATPALLSEQLTAEREAGVEKATDIVEQEFRYRRPCAAPAPRRAWAAPGIAQVAGEGALEVLKIGGRCGAHQAAPGSRVAGAEACSRAICSTSAVNAARSGMLKSRLRQVGTLPPMRR